MNIKIPRNRLYFTKKAVLRAFSILFTPRCLKEDYVLEFENKFAAFLGVKHAIAVSSGKLSLYLCLKYLGAKPGDKIILSDFNVPEVPALLVSYGLNLVLVDIDPSDFNINVGLIEKNIDEKTKFLVITHIYGTPARMDEIIKIAQKHKLKIIEDACQAVGAEYKGRKTGSLGDAGYFSFGTFKVFSALSGGMIVTDNDALASAIRQEVRDYLPTGRKKLFTEMIKMIFIMFFTSPKVFQYLTYPLLSLINKYDEDLKFRLFQGPEIASMSVSQIDLLKRKFSNLQSLIGLENLKAFPVNQARYLHRAHLLDEALHSEGIEFQRCPANSKSSYFKYTVRVKGRKEILRRLFCCGVDATYGYIKACSSISNFHKFSSRCPESLRLMGENIYLPIHSLTCDSQVYHLANLLSVAVKNQNKETDNHYK